MPEEHAETFEDLLERARRGDEAGREALFTRIADEEAEGAVLLAMARKLLPTDDRMRDFVESRDLIQSALRSGWLDLADFRGNTPGEFLAWIRTILRRKLAQLARKKRPSPSERVEDAPGLDSGGPAAFLMREEVRSRVQSALQLLSADQREVMELRLQGLQAPEIASRLGLQADAVRQRSSRAAKRLRELLDEFGSSGG